MSIEAIIDRYCEAWSDPEPAARAAALAEVWAQDARYTDPRADAYGTEALLEHIASVLAQRPGARVVRTSAVQLHHGFARFAWQVIEADGTRLPEGLDIAMVGEDGRITQIIGFFGPLPTDTAPQF
ncbi:nuclear transport factor 2 family protein [Enterobacter roggenkampii]|uniref:nuclear transport factor 2 family protein n=1 Tax=Enterobacter cloacae complex TaxID=354276 RepID=UPI002379BB33|nr:MULTISPECIES: nuclear transport factor 2 family protein [Enterobacter cloacae complex]MDD9237224.1 nuclear transport factor 2 family protein [Enterobacter kobei]MDD9242054.1 nuclear transport factor 2 family protein [Enterobacter roggenkampii]